METYKIKKWKCIDDEWAFDKNYPRIILANSSDTYASLTCEIHRGGLVKLIASSGGGHGEPDINDNGRSMIDWLELFEEAQAVQKYYYKG